MVDYVSVDYYLRSRGSHNWTDQWGSTVTGYDVGIKLIRAPTTPAQRKAAGCVDPGVVTDGS